MSTLPLIDVVRLFRSLTGMEVLLFSCATDEGEERPLVDDFRWPQFCLLVRGNPEGLARCIASHRDMAERICQAPERDCLYCHAGLASIHTHSNIPGIGDVDMQVIAGIPEELVDCSALCENVHDLNLSEKRLIEAARSLPVMSQSAIVSARGWLKLFATSLRSGQEPNPESARTDPVHNPVFDSPNDSNGLSVEKCIRSEIGRVAILPPAGGALNCGCSATLVDGVFSFVERYYDLSLSTKAMAATLGFEVSYFAKMCRCYRGTSFIGRLRRVRLDKSKTLLENPFLSLKEIASMTGFSSSSYFTRVFRQEFGISPSQYRKAKL